MPTTIRFTTGDLPPARSRGKCSSGAGFNPLGTLATPFSGVLDGLGHVISGLAGRNSGTITHVFTTGSVSASNRSAGGLVGYNNGTITQAYATGTAHAGIAEAGYASIIRRGTPRPGTGARWPATASG
jgi:hypothetical protein